jgi:hypothetical protein
MTPANSRSSADFDLPPMTSGTESMGGLEGDRHA